MEDVGWIAYARLPTDSEALTVFAELDDAKSVCQIAAPRAPTP
jgi:hypothetical protein